MTFIGSLFVPLIVGVLAGALGAAVLLAVMFRAAIRPQHRAALVEPIASPVRPSPGTAPDDEPDAEGVTGLQIAQALGDADFCVLVAREIPGLILEIHVGLEDTPEHRPATREEWDRCRAAGVSLLPWEHVVRLRASLSAGRPGTA